MDAARNRSQAGAREPSPLFRVGEQATKSLNPARSSREANIDARMMMFTARSKRCQRDRELVRTEPLHGHLTFQDDCFLAFPVLFLQLGDWRSLANIPGPTAPPLLLVGSRNKGQCRSERLGGFFCGDAAAALTTNSLHTCHPHGPGCLTPSLPTTCPAATTEQHRPCRAAVLWAVSRAHFGRDYVVY
jgi:hypothetical protein